MNYLDIVGRDQELFSSDINFFDNEMVGVVSRSRFLVIGGAGSIGQALTKEIFRRSPNVTSCCGYLAKTIWLN